MNTDIRPIVMKTTNGDNTWQYVSIPVNSTHDRVSYIYLKFIDENIGFIYISSRGINNIFSTINGGLNWTLTDYINITNVFPVLDMDYVNINDSLYVGSTAGDNRFSISRGHLSEVGPMYTNQLYGTTGSLTSVDFIDTSIGWAVGSSNLNQGAIFNTINNGVNWNIINTPYTIGQLECVNFSDANNGIIVGYLNTNITILTTKDVGLNWNIYSAMDGSMLSGFSINENLAYAVGHDSSFNLAVIKYN